MGTAAGNFYSRLIKEVVRGSNPLSQTAEVLLRVPLCMMYQMQMQNFFFFEV